MADHLQESRLKPAELRASICTEIAETRRAFHQFLKRLFDQDLELRSYFPAWSVGELLYHMNTTPKNLPNDLNFIRRLQRIPKIHTRPFNWLHERITRRGARNAIRNYLAEQYQLGHEKTIRALECIQDDEWHPFLSSLVTIER